MAKYKLVPIEPTPKMKQYGGEANTALLSLTSACDYAADAYRAMVASAPDVQGEPVEAGLYAVYLHDHWDAEGDTYWILARKLDNGAWVSEESGKELIQYEGDEILKEVPLVATPKQPSVSVLVEALEEISDPIRFMEERLEEGERLNGMAAVQLAGDASYLRDIATDALATYHNQGADQ